MKVTIERRYVVTLLFDSNGPPPKDVAVVWCHDKNEARIKGEPILEAWSIGHWAGYFPSAFVVEHSGRAVDRIIPFPAEPDTRITIQYDKADILEPFDKNLDGAESLTEWHLDEWAESLHGKEVK